MNFSDERRSEIEMQARKLLENFSIAIAKAETHEKEISVKISSGFREEGTGKENDDDFRERFFANAPETKGDCIIAEKKKW